MLNSNILSAECPMSAHSAKLSTICCCLTLLRLFLMSLNLTCFCFVRLYNIHRHTRSICSANDILTKSEARLDHSALHHFFCMYLRRTLHQNQLVLNPLCKGQGPCYCKKNILLVCVTEVFQKILLSSLSNDLQYAPACWLNNLFLFFFCFFAHQLHSILILN